MSSRFFRDIGGFHPNYPDDTLLIEMPKSRRVGCIIHRLNGDTYYDMYTSKKWVLQQLISGRYEEYTPLHLAKKTELENTSK